MGSILLFCSKDDSTRRSAQEYDALKSHDDASIAIVLLANCRMLCLMVCCFDDRDDDDDVLAELLLLLMVVALFLA